MNIFRQIRRWLWLAILIALTFGSHCWNWEQVFIGNHTYFVDADCYARMTRVQQVMVHPWRPIRFHNFENAPEGITPHTTAPMDFAIAILAKVLQTGFWMTGHSGPADSLDLAGAFISPLLSVALLVFLWWWAARLKLPYRNAMLLIVALSPILTHGFSLGRPDHQALTIAFLGAAFAAELALWKQPSKAWDTASGACWGLALWVSLFEPLILLLLILLLRGIFFRKVFLREGRPWGAMVFGALLFFALVFDGWRGAGIAAGYGEVFNRWASGIGELSHVSWKTAFLWAGWLLPLVPILLLVTFRRTKDRSAIVMLVLLVAVTGLTFWHARWGYYLALCFALSLPWALPVFRWRMLAWAVFFLSLWPMAQAWDSQLFPNEEEQRALAEKRMEAVLLREAAMSLVAPESHIVLAPWWLCPPLAYWSGQPCVAGSSHQSLPGIVDTAKFYLATHPAEAREILQRRSVTYVVAYEPSRIMENSSRILGIPASSKALGDLLYDTPHAAPGFLRLVYRNQFFKVFEFTGR